MTEQGLSYAELLYRYQQLRIKYVELEMINKLLELDMEQLRRTVVRGVARREDQEYLKLEVK